MLIYHKPIIIFMEHERNSSLWMWVRGGNGDICNSVNNKNKVKKRI